MMRQARHELGKTTGIYNAKSAFHNTENCHCDRGVLSYNGIQEKREKIMNYTYIVECKDGTLYTGWKSELHIITAGKAPNTRGRESRSHLCIMRLLKQKRKR